MSRQIIDIGVTPNDGTGDPLRTAMIKINDNFSEIYGSYTATGPIIVASDTSNTTITDKRITVSRLELANGLYINSSTLFVNSNNYFSTANGLVTSNLAVGYYVRSNGQNVTVSTPDGSVTVISGNNVLACTFSVAGGLTIDNTGIKTSGGNIFGSNNIVTSNLTIGTVNINPNSLINKNTIIGAASVNSIAINGQDIYANSSIRVGDKTTITPSAIQTNGLGIGSVAVTMDNITVGGTTPAGGITLDGQGILAPAATVNGEIFCLSLRAKELHVDEQVIDKLVTDSIQIGDYSFINSNSMSTQNAYFTTVSSYNTTVNNQLIVGNTVFISAFSVTVPSLAANGLVSADRFKANGSLVCNSASIAGGLVNIDNNGISANKFTTVEFNSPIVNVDTMLTVGSKIVLSGGVANVDTVRASNKIVVDNGTGLGVIEMGSDGAFRTGENVLNFYGLRLGIANQQQIQISSDLFGLYLPGSENPVLTIAPTNGGQLAVGTTVVNSTSIYTDNFSAANFAVNSLKVASTDINSGGVNTNFIAAANSNITKGLIGGINFASNVMSIGAASFNGTGVYIAGGPVVNTSGIYATAVFANGDIGTPGQVLTTDGSKTYWSTVIGGDPDALKSRNNLSDLSNVVTARNNLEVPDIRGDGATGTWNIGISGRAATAGRADSAATVDSVNNGDLYITSNQLNSGFNTDAASELAINYFGYQTGTSQFRDLRIFDGKNQTTAWFQGSTRNFYSYGDVTAYYSSDISLKENITPIKDALAKVMSVSGVNFDWKDDYLKELPDDDYFNRKHDVGFLAQEIEKILPEAVATRPNGIKAVRYERVIPLLLEAIKDLKKEINGMKKDKA